MTMTEPTLWDAAARHTDPATSWAAARRDRFSLRLAVLDTIRLLDRAYHQGATVAEITATLADRGIDRQENSIARRVTSLRKAGLVRTTGQTRDGGRGADQTVWEPVQ